jgi:sterol 24-C-methyltransferase
MRKREVAEGNSNVAHTAQAFRARFDGEAASAAERKENAAALVNEYYDLCTDFYEWGWGSAFHFAPRYQRETFLESLSRHEYFLALKGGFTADMRLLDLGCGVGGPLRNMVRFTHAHVTGVNNNAYQVRRARQMDEKLGLAKHTSYIRGDFNDMPIDSGTADGAYAIEATCHAADKTCCYSEVFRTLKPGAAFVAYEWIITDKYNDADAEHRRIRHGIELGNGLPSLETAGEVNRALLAAGFAVEESYDLITRHDKLEAKQFTWYEPLQGSYFSLNGLRSTPVGRRLTSAMVWAMELARLAPKGSYATADILEEAAVNLVRGGELGIFTPAYFFVARKPAQQ